MNGGTDVDLILAIQLQEQFEEELKNYNKSPDNSNAAIQIMIEAVFLRGSFSVTSSFETVISLG